MGKELQKLVYTEDTHKMLFWHHVAKLPTSFFYSTLLSFEIDHYGDITRKPLNGVSTEFSHIVMGEYSKGDKNTSLQTICVENDHGGCFCYLWCYDLGSRKSRIQLEVPKLRSKSLVIIMVLKVKLKLKKNLTQVSLLPRCSRNECRPRETFSCLPVTTANELQHSRSSDRMELKCIMTSFTQHFIMMDVKATW